MDPMTNGTPDVMPSPAASMPAPDKKSGKLTTIVILLVIIIAMLTALTMVNSKKEKEVDMQIMQKQAEIKASDETIKQIENLSTSDETTDIQKDLNATNIDSINLQ
jgi:flagellar basal body-associated protein FliL